MENQFPLALPDAVLSDGQEVLQRVSSIDDIVVLTRLARVIWKEHYTPIIGVEQVEYMLDNLHSPEVILKQIKVENYFYFLLKNHDASVGYIGFFANDKHLFLSKIYVALSARGTGLGRVALEFIKEAAQLNGLKKIALTVNKNNSNTIAAYYKMGFIRTGEICVDIGGGYYMDDLQMELLLN